MAGRQSRVSAPRALNPPPTSTSASSRQKGNKKRKDRGLHAYSIAEKTAPEKVKVRQYRLGEVEEDGPRRKRPRVEDDGENEEDDDVPAPRAKARNGLDDLDEDAGSDSDGNIWHTGTIAEDEDSDVDSDEAFGESDEEKFEGFTFRGSSTLKDRKRKKPAADPTASEDFNLDEDASEEDGDESMDEDDFGEEGIDLADMLDQDESDEEIVAKPKRTNEKSQKARSAGSASDFALEEQLVDDDSMSEDDEPSEYSDEDGDGQFEMSDDEADGDDADKQHHLQQMVAAMSKQDEPVAGGEQVDRNQMLARALAALKSSSSTDPTFSREAQKLSRSFEASAKESKKSTLVSAPLPKRQQDRIDRTAARGETNKTLDRWVDTVKHNRRAEHLTFPLVDPHASEAYNTNQLSATADEKPRNELEATIANILKESGLGAAGGAAGEKELQGFENLQTNKMSLEEVTARRAELRKQRELMFREEIKSKRIKKIKSKAYRRVHRKDAAKAAQKERDLLVAAGIHDSDDERELNDRRRAEERMGGRHRESRWAKAVKQTGRATWDEDARDGVTEMARRNEELRRRMEGKAEEGDDMDSDVSSDSETYELHGDEDGDRQRLQRQLGRLDNTEPEQMSRLGGLAFMQRAEAARKKDNERELRQLQRDLASDGSQVESEEEAEVEDTAIGRKVFGPSETAVEPRSVLQRGEFEEGQDSEAEDDSRLLDSTLDGGVAQRATEKATAPGRTSVSASSGKLVPPKPAKAFEPQERSSKGKRAPPAQVEAEKLEPAQSAADAKETSAPNTKGWTTITYGDSATPSLQQDPPLSDDDEEIVDKIAPSNFELVQAAFGGDDVDGAFAAEKAEAAESEDEKITDTALPGWGSWAGEGISKREKKRIAARTKNKFLVKTADGVKPEQRKDRNLDKVIISEKKMKKTAKYLASTLPHPFESRMQYERGLRQPIGPEWTTKETFQQATKPRVLVKPGRAIQPMTAPML